MSDKKSCYALILCYAIAHLALIGSLDLGVDEAHYGLFALKPDWSYFDHPPMVGWLQVIGQSIGQNTLGLRIIPLACMIINSLLLVRLARTLAPHTAQIGIVTLTLFYLSAITQLFGWGMVPDVPLMTWSLLTLLLAIRLREGFDWRKFALLGVTTGLAGITKYTAVVLPVALFIWLVMERQLWKWLQQPGLWLAVGIACICISPVLYWNIQHDWISFSYQFAHGTEGNWSVADFLVMQISQLVIYSPLVYISALFFCARTLGAKIAKKAAVSSSAALALTTALLYLAMVGWSAGNGELLPHWAAVGWLLMTPLCAQVLLRAWQQKGAIVRLCIGLGAALSIALVCGVFILVGAKPVGLFPQSKALYKDVLGWKEATQQAVVLAKEHKTHTLWVQNWSHASRVDWYSHRHNTVVQVLGEKPNQYDLWYGKPADGSVAVLIEEGTAKKAARRVATSFIQSDCTWLKEYVHIHDGVVINHFHFYLCQ